MNKVIVILAIVLTIFAIWLIRVWPQSEPPVEQRIVVEDYGPKLQEAMREALR